MSRRLLVTGASGFMGQHVLKHLQKTDLEVHAVSCSAAPDSLLNYASWHRCNLLSESDASKLVKTLRPDICLHMAWYTDPKDFWSSSQNLTWLNATLTLAKMFKECGGSRFIGIGSCAEYDWSQSPCIEDVTPLEPDTLYGASKKAAYEVLKAYFATENISFLWARLFWLFGPGEPSEKLVSSMIKALSSGEELKLQSPRDCRDFLPAPSAAEAIKTLVTSELTGAFNICSGRSTEVQQLAETISGLMGISQNQVLAAGHQKTKESVVFGDNTKLKAKTRWEEPADFSSDLLSMIKTLSG